MMQLLAPVDNIRFDIEDALEKQIYSVPLPFVGMDKSAAAVCELFAKASCDKGNLCPFRHVRGDKSVVCKHWLRGLCKKGDECEFLHEYDMSKMPECYFYSKYGQCGNKECEFLHLDRESKIKDCPWYDRGFCRHGPNCKNRHLKKVICQNYLFGFCPDGPGCKFKHPKFELPVADPLVQQKKQLFVCDFCGEKGHKIASCFKLNPENRQNYQSKLSSNLNTSGYRTDMSHGPDAHHSANDDLINSISSYDLNNEQNNPGTGGGGLKLPVFNSNAEKSNADNENKPVFNNNNQQTFNNNSVGQQPQFNSNNSGGQQQQQQQQNGSFYQQGRPNFHFGNNHHNFGNSGPFGVGMGSNGHHHHHHGHHNQGYGGGGGGFGEKYQPLPPSEVTCFKCGEKGHYANKCNKTVFAFLRSAAIDQGASDAK